MLIKLDQLLRELLEKKNHFVSSIKQRIKIVRLLSKISKSQRRSSLLSLRLFRHLRNIFYTGILLPTFMRHFLAFHLHPTLLSSTQVSSLLPGCT